MRIILLLAAAVPALATAQADLRTGESTAAGARPLAALFAGSPEKAFRDHLAKASGPVIHRGLPAGKPRPAESTPLLREGDALFYPDPLSLAEPDRVALQAVFSEGDPFAPGSPPPCGSFHPDFLLIWKKDDAIWSTQLAFGCQEALVIGPGVRFHRYIRPQAYGTLARLLGKFTAE